MARLTKAAVIAAHDEVSELVEGFNPPIDTSVKQGDLEARFNQVLLDIALDDEDRSELSEETIATIDRLAKKFPDMKPSPDEDEEEEQVEDAEVVEEEKPKKKGKKDKKKSKKSKKEEPAEEEEVEEKPKKKGKKSKKEEPVKEEKKSKKAKGKKGNAGLAKEIEGASFKELQSIVKDNDVFEGFPSVGLKTDVFRASLLDVLNGDKTVEEVKAEAKAIRAAGKEKAKDKPKKEKKSKKSEPTLTEKVEAIEDLKELKAFCKENKDSFPGVKAKKFDKVKKLRKAMLKVVVEAAPKKKKSRTGKTLEETRNARQERIDYITKLLKDNGGQMNRKELTEAALEKFPEPAKAVKDLISYGKNEKYNKFEKLLVQEGEIIAFEGTKIKGAKADKKKGKAKKEEAPAPKADKKGKKKDKKKDKKKKKK